MATVSEIRANQQKFQALVDGNKFSEANTLLSQLKIALYQQSALHIRAGEPSSDAKQLKELAREILEWGVILSSKMEDMSAFERNVTQLKVYYDDYSHYLAPSKLQYTITGMRLLQLLVENRMAEFHGELEKISEEHRKEENIAFAMKLEQYLMEGSYNKVLESRAQVPNPYCKYFMKELLETVRDGQADCIELAYPSLSVDDVQKMLILDSKKDLETFLREKKPEWKLQASTQRITFLPSETGLKASDIPSMRLVQETLTYATELDRIV